MLAEPGRCARLRVLARTAGVMSGNGSRPPGGRPEWVGLRAGGLFFRFGSRPCRARGRRVRLEAEVAAERTLAVVAAMVALVLSLSSVALAAVGSVLSPVLVALAVLVSGVGLVSARRARSARRELARRAEGRCRGLRRSGPVALVRRSPRFWGVLGVGRGILGALTGFYGRLSDRLDRRFGRIGRERAGRVSSRAAGGTGDLRAGAPASRPSRGRGHRGHRGHLSFRGRVGRLAGGWLRFADADTRTRGHAE